MLRLTKEGEYAFLLLSALLEAPEQAKSATTLSQQTGIALPMTGKVLKRLVKHHILTSTRGAYGGYQLIQAPETVTALAVVQAMEGVPELVDCLGRSRRCELVAHCQISPFWRQLNADIQAILESRTLADMQYINQRALVRLSVNEGNENE